MVRFAASAVLALGVATGCQTQVGNYFANRARDFGECFRVQLVVPRWNPDYPSFNPVGFGGGVRAAGLMDLGFGFGGLFWSNTGGWWYGRPLWGRGDTVDLWIGPLHQVIGGAPPFGDDRGGYWVLPAVFGEYLAGGIGRAGTAVGRWASPWSAPLDDAEGRWHRVHAFDIEVAGYAGFLGVHLGFSPGEFLDFVLGWIGSDLAGDDRGLGLWAAQDPRSAWR